MAISNKACSRCGKPVSMQTVPAISGTEGPYRLGLENLPVMICAENHKRFVYPDLAMRLMDHVGNPDASGIHAATRRGLFKKHAQCAKCAAELPEDKTDTTDFRVTVPLPDIQPVALTLTAPVLKCPQCGTTQLPDSAHLLKYVFKAMTHAFRSTEIHAQ